MLFGNIILQQVIQKRRQHAGRYLSYTDQREKERSGSLCAGACARQL
jgi:hypothetical protein